VAKFFILLMAVSLTGNLFPVLNVSAILGLLFLYLWNHHAVSADVNTAPVAALRFGRAAYVFWVSSYLITGASLANLFSFDFLRRDGALLIAYLPLFIVADYRFDERFVRRVLSVFLSVLSAVAVLGVLEFADAEGVPLGLSALPDELQFVHYAQLSEFGFHGLFEAHNAAGAVYALAACISLALLFYSSKPRFLSLQTFWFASTFAGLALSKSRTAYVAFAGTCALGFLFDHKKFKRALRVGLIAVLPMLYIWSVQPEVSERAMSVNNSEDPNIATRFIRFEIALQDFVMSPLIGIGFGRYNDNSLSFSGIENFAYVATGGEVINEASHAHNSYLHFLAEGGVVGLSLMLGIWISTYQWAKRTRDLFTDGTFGSSMCRAVQGCVVLEFLLSFTEHSMGTAVSSLTILTMVGLLRNLAASEVREKTPAAFAYVAAQSRKRFKRSPILRPGTVHE
jgi:O-antigen ligase